MIENQNEIQKWTDYDQQMIARAVVRQVREFADSRRHGSSLDALNLSDEFRKDFFETANKVLAKWWDVGAPFPTIQGFDILKDGTDYRHNGEEFMHFVRVLVQPDIMGGATKTN